MKGSPATLGAIQGTAGHGSALKKLAESPAKLRPSYVGGVMVSDNEADLAESTNEAIYAGKTEGKIQDVDRKGQSEIKHIKKTNPNLNRLDKDMIEDAQKWSNENRDEEQKSFDLNKKKQKELKKKKAPPTTMRDSKKTKY